MLKNLTISERTNDYDSCHYIIYKKDEETPFIQFGFTCNCVKIILENGGQEMLDELYADFKAPPGTDINGFEICLQIDISKLPETKKLSKKWTEEE